ncbi:MAG TPA: glutaredoxin family protein [Steroidobacteraceae bacterium]
MVTSAGTLPAPLCLYVREGCPLCDEFLVDLSADLGPGMAALAIIDVDGDPALALRVGLRVPVLEAAGAVVFEGRYDRNRVRQALRL